MGESLKGVVLQNRAKYFDNHPLLAGKIILPTRPLQQMLGLIRTTALLRAPGGWISAPSGMGKTAMLTYLEHALPRCSSAIQVVRYSARTHHQLAVRAFHQRMIKALDCPNVKGETELLCSRVTSIINDRARTRGRPLIVIMIDETQAMKPGELYFLKDITNDCTNTVVQLVPILVGQEPQMPAFIQEVFNEKRLDLTGRFGIRRLPFAPYSTLEDIQGLLEQIDKAVYPKGSGCTWTQFFFPEAWEGGFRMKNEAVSLREVLQSVAQTVRKPDRFPIREITLAIRTFATVNAALDKRNLELPQNAWESAVEFSCLAKVMELFGEDDSWVNWEVKS